MRRAACLAAVLFHTGTASGCDENSADAEAIQQVRTQYGEAVNTKNGKMAAELVTAASADRYRALVKVAIGGTRADLERLDAYDLREVLIARFNGDRREIEKLYGRAYIAYSTAKGWYGEYLREPDTLKGFKIKGDYATARIDEQDSVVTTAAFWREEGKWRLDEESFRAGFNEYVSKAADAERVFGDRGRGAHGRGRARQAAPEELLGADAVGRAGMLG